MPPTQPTVDGSFILLVADSIEKMGEKIISEIHLKIGFSFHFVSVWGPEPPESIPEAHLQAGGFHSG